MRARRRAATNSGSRLQGADAGERHGRSRSVGERGQQHVMTLGRGHRRDAEQAAAGRRARTPEPRRRPRAGRRGPGPGGRRVASRPASDGSRRWWSRTARAAASTSRLGGPRRRTARRRTACAGARRAGAGRRAVQHVGHRRRDQAVDEHDRVVGDPASAGPGRHEPRRPAGATRPATARSSTDHPGRAAPRTVGGRRRCRRWAGSGSPMRPARRAWTTPVMAPARSSPTRRGTRAG